MLVGKGHYEESAAGTLIAFLEAQRGHTGAALPSSSHLLVEETYPHQSKAVRHLLVVSLFGGVVNYPLGILLQDEIESRFGPGASVFSDNDSIVIQTDAEEPTVSHVVQILRELPTSYQAIEAALRRRLEGSGLFGTRFRENAGRALLLPRAGFDRRTPLWVNRMRARGLLQAVSGIPDFPITAETWRSCLEEDFDLPSLIDRLSDIREGRIRISKAVTETPSPFAKSTLWAHSNLRMYETDEPRGRINQSALSSEIIREIALDPRLRPEIPEAVAESFQARVQRLLPGYAPATKEELVDWVKERLAIPREEWETFSASLPEDVRPGEGEAPEGLVMFDAGALVSSLERLPDLALLLDIDQSAVVERSGLPEQEVRRAFEKRPWERHTASDEQNDDEQRATQLILEWLSFYGPLEQGYISDVLTIDPSRLEELLSFAKEGEAIVTDLDGEGRLCEFRNYESILRILRRRGREAVESLPATELLPFLREYRRRRLAAGGNDPLRIILTAFEGYSAPFNLWDTELLQSIIPDYQIEAIEGLFRNRQLCWVGTGRRRITLIDPEDLELIRDERQREPHGSRGVAPPSPGDGRPDAGAVPGSDLFPDTAGWYAYQDLLGRGTEGVRADLWNLAWRGFATSDSYDGLRRELSEKRSRGREGSRGVSFGGMPPSPTTLPGVPPEEDGGGRRLRRRGRYRGASGGRRRIGLSGPGRYQGLWRRLPDASELFEGYDAYDFEELNRDRARLLLDRYGILFREILTPELPALSWGRIFRSLRLMELAGEVVGGVFFEGVPGIQFARPEVAELLARWPEEAPVARRRGPFRLNAMDPISLCGRGVGELGYELPPRVAGTSLSYDRGELLAVARRGGSELTLRVPPEDSRVPDIIELLKEPLRRRSRPNSRLIVRSVNGEPAGESSAAARFLAAGFRKDQGELVFWAPYQ